MKLLLVTLLLSSSAFAGDCKVYGISDSPQKLNCKIQDGLKIHKLRLGCEGGVYKLSWYGKSYNVTNAYHQEVESGSNPLVFEAEGLALTTVSHKGFASAEVVSSVRAYKGVCFK